uniref:Uncharacterized protein n=1 Tax=Cyclophora tenuis TaxID=216820 RepID=A0A7S1D1N8_CYCTE|mmetsp:Transcript_16607/g.28168  ORF Transcript_16607/g.28168 Transcript_16607/m.28168 type:complete len:104 (+) Transcript_16607:627-938(+)
MSESSSSMDLEPIPLSQQAGTDIMMMMDPSLVQNLLLLEEFSPEPNDHQTQQQQQQQHQQNTGEEEKDDLSAIELDEIDFPNLFSFETNITTTTTTTNTTMAC